MSKSSELVTAWLRWWSIPSPPPDSRGDLVTRIDAAVAEARRLQLLEDQQAAAITRDRAVAEARREERQAISALIRKRLVYDSQRAVSWHEIQDCLEAIGPASAPEGEPR